MSRTLLVVLALLASTPAVAAELKLTAADGRTRTVTEAGLKAMPRTSLKLREQEVAPFEGVALRDLLETTGVLAAGGEMRGPALALVMVVRASDGYVVALPVSDLDPDFHPGRIVLADSWNGAPLPADEGPFRLVVEGEGRPARSAHSVVAIEIRNLR
jgi:hypothetical protein